MLVSIIIPSRLANSPVEDALFLDGAIASIRSQTNRANVEIIVGIDTGMTPPKHLVHQPGLAFVESSGRSQAAALNAAARLARGDVIAFLEDDDRWMPAFLDEALAARDEADFVSSTQLEVDITGTVTSVVDFPTPSGWLMHRSVWEAVGQFDEAFRWHIDNQWLGRLAEAGVRRAHLVEATAPIDPPSRVRQARPWLGRSIDLSAGHVRLRRHPSPWPLVRRLVHDGSGLSAINRNPTLKKQSQEEYIRLTERFGRVPW